MKAILLGFIMLLVNCGPAPVLNIVDKPIDVSPPLSLELTYEAIALATSQLGWELEEIEPGLALATLHIRSHMAQVQIAYTPQKYSITYKKSNRLKYDGENIHKSFNNWINNLDKHIQQNLRIVTKIANTKEIRITVAYDIVFDFKTLESDDAMDNRFTQGVPIWCRSAQGIVGVFLMAPCIVNGIAYSGAWTLDKILHEGDTKEWQSCLERLSTSFRSLDGLTVIKPPVHTFLNSRKLIPAIELTKGLENLSQKTVSEREVAPKFRLEFSLKGPKIINIGDDGLVYLSIKGVLLAVRKTHNDRLLKTWRNDSHQSLTKLCEGQTDSLIKQQINGLIESLLKQMWVNLPHLE